jgi:ligand-binding sensor domain-containing protein/signal transduction histidine kinase
MCGLVACVSGAKAHNSSNEPMSAQRSLRRLPGVPRPGPQKKMGRALLPLIRVVVLAGSVFGSSIASAVALWSDSGVTLIHDSGAGKDILEGAVKRDDTSRDTLYFKFHVSPLSDGTTEEYFAALELYEGDAERLAVGNAPKAWAYSAFFNIDETGGSGKVAGYVDLRSSKPEQLAGGVWSSYEVPIRGKEKTIVFKVQYVAGGDDLVTVWLDPDLGPGANEVYQPESLTTRFSANASFDEIRLRHGGGGGGWIFSDIAVATSFSDFADTSSAKPGAELTWPDGLSISFQSWQRDQGLPHKAVRALAQTSDGFVWLGSEDGLTRFDGARFVTYERQPGWQPGPVRVLLGDRTGGLWIGKADGALTRLQNGRFKTFGDADGLPGGTLLALLEDDQGKLWAGSELGLAVQHGDKFVRESTFAEIDDKPVTALFKDQRGAIWIGVKGAGVFLFRGGTLTRIIDASVETLLQDPHCGLVDQAQRIWIGAGDDFVLCREGEQWRRYRIPRHGAQRYVSALALEPDGTVWAGSVNEGLFQFKNGKLKAINASSGLSDNLVESLLVDREGKLWVGTEAGLNRLRRKNLLVFGQDEGLGYGMVKGLAEVAPGEIWAAKPGDGLYRWEGRTFSRLNAAGLPVRDARLGAILVARDASCWVATGRGLVWFKDPQAVSDESRLMGLTNLNILALAEDSVGRIWAGTREGELWRLEQGTWQQQSNAWGTHPVTALLPERGFMWVGTEGDGIYRLGDGVQPGAAVHFGKSSGLPAETIRALCQGQGGALWIGTGGGLGWLRNGTIRTFSTQDGLPDNTISQIMIDEIGRLWLGTARGIGCLSTADLESLDRGSATIHLRIYERAEGMLAEECTGGFSPAGLKAKSGQLWFATLKGVVVADPGHHPANPVAPNVVLDEVLVDGVPMLDSAAGPPGMRSLKIKPGKHRFELQYTGLAFDALEQMRFRYQMEGLDPGWVEAGARHAAFYNYVPPGNYRFRVAASNSDGMWSETSANLALSVSPHFWQKGWVIVMAAAGLLVSVGAAARIIEKRKSLRRLQRIEQERALERERARIAQDLHDEMGARLCRISFLSEHARRADVSSAEVRQHVDSISEASRDVLHSLDEIVWAVNPKNDSLEHVVSYIGQYAHDYFQMTGIECELDIAAQFPAYSLSSQVRHHLFLATHEAFSNILKHSGATRAKVKITCEDASFQIAAFDNGRGFNNHLSGADAANGSDSSNGLRNMRERMAAIGGGCEIQSHAGQGTTLLFVLPLQGFPKHE